MDQRCNRVRSSGLYGSFRSLFVWVKVPDILNMPDPDQKYLVIMYIKNCNKRSILSNRAVTNILRMPS